MDERGVILQKTPRSDDGLESLVGERTVGFLAWASCIIDMIENEISPFDGYLGYRSTFDMIAAQFIGKWPAFSDRLDKDKYFYDILKSALKENDRAIAFRTPEPDCSYALVTLLNLIEDEKSLNLDQHSQVNSKSLDDMNIKEIATEIVGALTRSDTYCTEVETVENGKLFKSRYGRSRWLSQNLMNGLSFNIQLTEFGDDMLQVTYHFQETGKQPLDFYFSGLPQTVLAAENSVNSNLIRESISNLVILCGYFARNNDQS